MKIEIVNKSNFELPKYATDQSAGLDLQAFVESPIEMKPLDRVLVPTGLYISIPAGYEGQIRGRSGMALKHGISLANGIGTIDSDYRGEIKVILINLSKENYTINNGDRIAQLIFNQYIKTEWKVVEKLTESERGIGGFGHSGY